MPFGRGRSDDELPTADDEGEVPAPEVPERPQAKSRPTQGVLQIIFGCGLALGLLALMYGSRGNPVTRGNPFSESPGTPTVSPSVRATLPTDPTGNMESADATEAPASTPAQPSLLWPTEATQPANVWAADIPEAACIPADLPQTGRVVDILDGDTIRVLLDQDGRVYSVRFLGVNAPALDGATAGAGREARVRSSELVYRKQVILVRDLTDTDASGTLLRYVLADGVFVNEDLIQEGLGQVEMSEPDTACLDTYLAAQQEAQAKGRGMWGAGSAATTTP
jgi:endonuclease YncB( thermonuclease family)